MVKLEHRNWKRIALVGFICFAVFFVLLLWGLSAAVDNESENSESIDYVRIGLAYSSTVLEEYSFTTDYGLEYGVQSKSNDTFEYLGTVRGSAFTIKIKTGYYSAAIYSYEKDGRKITEREELNAEISSLIAGDDISYFEHFSGDGQCEIRLGAFSSKAETEEYLLKIAKRLEGVLETRIVYEDADTVYVCDNSGNVVTGYTQTDDEYAIAVRPLCNEGEMSYIVRRNQLLFEGVFEFRRYTNASVDGISIITIVPTDRYIACVMSYEISPSSEHEVQKAFSIAVRNYTYDGIDKHKSYDFDLCSETHCQVYRGSDRLNDNVVSASKETAGLVLANASGKLADIFYASTAGGCTVAIDDTWATSAQSHLVGVPTPWEKYKSYNSYTKWTVEYTPNELYNLIKDDCTNIKGNIAKVAITLCDDSPHVYSITYTDVYGNSQTVTGATTLRVMLGLNSSCFVVGKGGQTVKRTVYSYDCYDSVYSSNYKGPLAVQVPKNVLDSIGSTLDSSEISLLKTYITEKYGSSSEFLSGTFKIDSRGTVMVTANGESLHFTENGLPDLFSANVVVKQYSVTLNGSSSNFVFDGMGWGHSVGLSQNGVKEMVAVGYDFKTILEVHFPTAKVVSIDEIK